MKYYLSIIIVSLISLGVMKSYSQTNLRELGTIIDPSKVITTPKHITKGKIIDSKIGKSRQDTVYCFQTTKRYGWFEPLGLLTREQVQHRSYSIMFTGKNAEGHWTKMECVNAYGKHTPGGFSPYIVKIGSEKDSLINDAWAEKLKGACIFEFIPDPTGKNIIQERAFDKDYNLLYAYSRVPIGSNQFIGSYKDVYGLPAEMRNESDYKYGTLVIITENDNGFDMRVEYIDAQRNNKPNADGAYAEMFDYNKDGEILSQYSVNSIGNKIKDNWGNCAVIHTYDKNHLNTSSMYADEHMKPMRMPSRESWSTVGIIKALYSYDENFRQSKVEFVTDKNLKDTNLYGCHKILFEYDDKGNQLSMSGYDINGNLAPIDESGTAQYLTKYDNFGNCTEMQFFDKENKGVSSNGYLCKIEYKYDDDNRLIGEKHWMLENDDYKLSYLFEETVSPSHKEEKTVWNDGSSCVKRYDKNNRETLIAYYGANGLPDYNYDNTWSYKTTQYLDFDNHVSKYIQLFYGVDGNLSQSENLEYNKKIAICDSITKQEFYKDYKNDILVNTFSKKYNDDYSVVIEQADNNIFGDIARTGGASGVRFYNAKVKWTPFADISYIVCVDEFDEPDYLSSDDGTIYYYTRSTAHEKLNMSAENDILDSSESRSYRDDLPKVMSVEVVDSIAYELGFRDNDVILLYGDYSVNLENIPSYFKFRRDWALSSVLEANKNSRMVVFRIDDAKNNKFGLVEIDNLIGSLSDLGIVAHIRYLTERQKARIISSINSNITGNNPIVTAEDFLEKNISEGNNYVVMAFAEMYRSYRNKPYVKHIIDPAILLGACIKDRDLYWTMDKGEDLESFEDMLDSRKTNELRYPIMNCYFTTDMNNIKPLTLKEQAIYAQWFDTRISDEDYNTLLRLNKISSSKIDSIKSLSPKFKTKNLLAYWETVQEDTKDNYNSITGHLKFNKNGTIDGKLYTYGMISFSEGNAIYRIEKDYSGNWNLRDSLIMITPKNEDNTRLTCIDLIGADLDLKNRAVSYMNSICETNKQSLLNDMKTLSVNLKNDIFIHSLSKDSLLLDIIPEHPIVFVKGKNKTNAFDKVVPSNDNISKTREGGNSEVDSRLIGYWEAQIPDFTNSLATLILNKDKSLYIKIHATLKQELTDTTAMLAILDINLGGEWNSREDLIKLDCNPSLMSINVDVDVEGYSEEESELIKPILQKELNSQKNELVMSLLKDSPFDGEHSLSEITDSSFIINGNKWIKQKE